MDIPNPTIIEQLHLPFGPRCQQVTTSWKSALCCVAGDEDEARAGRGRGARIGVGTGMGGVARASEGDGLRGSDRSWVRKGTETSYWVVVEEGWGPSDGEETGVGWGRGEGGGHCMGRGKGWTKEWTGRGQR